MVLSTEAVHIIQPARMLLRHTVILLGLQHDIGNSRTWCALTAVCDAYDQLHELCQAILKSVQLWEILQNLILCSCDVSI